MAHSKDQELEISVQEIVDYMKIRGSFGPYLSEVVQRKLTVQAAKEAGLSVSDDELQSSADAFRIIYDLRESEETENWLKSNGISLEALENHLETNILLSKYKDWIIENNWNEILESEDFRDSIRDAAYKNWLRKNLKE